MSRQQKFLARKHSFAPGSDPATLLKLGIDPLSLPNLLWWDDIAAILSPPADGSGLITVPVHAGTNSSINGVAVTLRGEFSGAFPAVYRTHGMANGLPGADFSTGGLLSHSGPAFDAYALTSGGGMTLYNRVNITGFTANETVSLGNCPVGAGMSWGYTVDASKSATLFVSLPAAGLEAFTPIGAGDHVLALVIPDGGMYSVYDKGALLGTQTTTGVAFETSNSGYGYQVGNPNTPFPKFVLSSFLCYQALHTSQQVSGISEWLTIYR